MDELGLWMIESLLQSKGCASGTFYEIGKDPNQLLKVLLEVVPRSDEFNEPRVLVVEGGAPEFFVLTGFGEPVIWYSKSFIGKYIRLRELIMRETDFDTTGIAILFEALAEFYNSLGDANAAQICYIQTLISAAFDASDSSCYDLVNKIASSGYGSQGESEWALASLYFGLSHEIGHVVSQSTALRKEHPLKTDHAAILEMVLKTGSRYFRSIEPPDSPGEFFDVWKARFDTIKGDNNSILSLTRLKSEIEADFYGFNLLVQFMERAYANQKASYNKKALVSEVIVGLFLIQLIDQCRYLAKNYLGGTKKLSDTQKTAKLDSIYFSNPKLSDDRLNYQIKTLEILWDFGIAHRVRVEYLRPILVHFVLLHLFPDTYVTDATGIQAQVGGEELNRRISVAEMNLSSYFDFYQKAIMQLLARFEDVSLFAVHLFTDTPPELADLNPGNKSTFTDAILANFSIYLDRLNRERSVGFLEKARLLIHMPEYIKRLERPGAKPQLLIQAYQKLRENVRFS